MPTLSHVMLDRMTEHIEDDLWVGICHSCGERFQISDKQLTEVYFALMLLLDEADEFEASCSVCEGPVTLARQTIKVVPFSSWTVLPAATGCPMCGTEHYANVPHDWQTLLYKYTFRSQEATAGREERWPTIRDAMAHCTPEVQQQWIDALRERGVEV